MCQICLHRSYVLAYFSIFVFLSYCFISYDIMSFISDVCKILLTVGHYMKQNNLFHFMNIYIYINLINRKNLTKLYLFEKKLTPTLFLNSCYSITACCLSHVSIFHSLNCIYIHVSH